MPKVVIFTKNNARILMNPADIDVYRAWENAVVDAELEDVKGLPPQHWFLTKQNKIIPMRSEYREQRDQDILEVGADNEVRELKYKELFKPYSRVVTVDLLDPPQEIATEADMLLSKTMALIPAPKTEVQQIVVADPAQAPKTPVAWSLWIAGAGALSAMAALAYHFLKL